MEIVRTPDRMRRLAELWRSRGLSIGFVPTMGALHAGHLSLIERARRGNRRVVVSSFVNPLQFGPKEDFARYPRPARRDAALCRAAGVDALFRPSAASMYPPDFRTRVDVEGLSDVLCGAFRPGHFRGVATVVLKLFEATRPDRAYFGEKDFQQLVLIRRLARELDLPLEVVGCPIVREPDGLALSSRNAYLSPAQRREAAGLHRALRAAARAGHAPGATPASALRAARRELARMRGARADCVSIVDSRGLEPARRLRGRLRVLAAVRLGKTRLIDNIPLICG